jgi:hypothetical protein
MPAPKKAYVPDARRDMHKELAAATALKHQLAEAFGEEHDLDLLRDMVEGETNLDGAVDKVLEQMAMDVATVQGLEKFESTMAARRKRICDRVDTMRAMLRSALEILEERRFERPIALVTLKPIAPKLRIIDEAEVPVRYFKQPDPVLSNADLTRDLKERRDVLDQKMTEIDTMVTAGEITAQEGSEAKARALALFPPIPGAELDNGSITIAVKWS